MGKAKDIVLSLGYRRIEAENIEFRLRDAGILIEEEEEKEEEKEEKRPKMIRKTVSEVKSDI